MVIFIPYSLERTGKRKARLWRMNDVEFRRATTLVNDKIKIRKSLINIRKLYRI